MSKKSAHKKSSNNVVNKWHIVSAILIIIVAMSIWKFSKDTDTQVRENEELFYDVQINGRDVKIRFWNHQDMSVQFDAELFAKRIAILERIAETETVYSFNKYNEIRLLIEPVEGSYISGLVDVQGKVARVTLNPWAIRLETSYTYLTIEQNLEAVLMDELANLVTWDIPNVDFIGSSDTSSLPAWYDSEVFSWSIYTAVASTVINLDATNTSELYSSVFVYLLETTAMPETYDVDGQPIYGAKISYDSFNAIFESYQRDGLTLQSN